MADTIFRLTNAGDTESSVDTTEKIIFNTGIVPDATGKMTRTSFRMASDLNPHPNPDIANNPIQDSLLGVTEVTVAGYFINHNTTVGPRNLYNWSIDPDTNSDFKFGRFGLDLKSFNHILDLQPLTGLGGTGYMLSEIFVDDVEDPRTEVPFIAKFLRNGAITTIAGKSVVRININIPGSGYVTTPPTVTITGGGFTRQAVGVAVLNPDGSVSHVVIIDAGTGYTGIPTVAFTAPTSGTTATGTAVIG